MEFSLPKKESEAILVLICLANLLFARFYFDLLVSVLNFQFLLVYFSVSFLVLGLILKILFNDAKNVFIFVTSLILSVCLISILIHFGEKKNVLETTCVIVKKNTFKPRVMWSIKHNKLELKKLVDNKNIVVNVGLVEYTNLNVGDTVDLIFHENLFYGLETIEGTKPRHLLQDPENVN